MSEIQLSERMQRLIEKKGGIPGVDNVSLPREQKTETVPSTEIEKKIDEYNASDGIDQIRQDIWSIKRRLMKQITD
ncbi:MAG: hypothetical protein UV30_C0014G0007 [Candidatus Collierbacteria bacterium GW2011_GWF1_42_50]|nr:MAG: hypothetical protein UV30_C0014G0007 [Candidatus Collierbacteria bacterium GW2011_GWF1_42_50]